MDSASIPVVDPTVQVVPDARGRLCLVRGWRLLRSLGGVAPADLDRLLSLVDGRRTAGEICEALSSDYDVESIQHLLDALEGTLLQRSASARAQARPERPVLVLGTGPMAEPVLRGLRELGLAVEGVPDRAWEETLASRFSQAAAVVFCLDGVPGRVLLQVNAAALKSRTPLLPMVRWGEELSVGPTVIPWKTACFECACWTAFAQGDQGYNLRDVLPSLQLGHPSRPLPAHVRELGGREAVLELERLVTGSAYPSLIGRVLRVDGAGGKAFLQAEPSTECGLCHGLTLAPPATRLEQMPPPPRVDWSSARPIRDRTGGLRSVSSSEARERALAALEKLNVTLHMSGGRLTAPYHQPLEEVPFFHARAEQRLEPGAPLVLPSELPENNFGKGMSADQAWCSGAFEWLERHLSRYHGGVRVLRAPYAEVREQAIDMPFYVQGLLEPYDVPGRRPFNEREPMDWVWGYCLRRERPILLPAPALFVWSDVSFRGHRMAMPMPGSSGVSAGCTLEDALLQGLLEVIEHDAWFSSMRTGLAMPSIDPATLPDPQSVALIERFQAAGFEVLIRELTNDLEIPSLQVLLRSRRDYTAYLSPGQGSHLDPVIALRRALTEAYQFLASILVMTQSAHQANSEVSIFERNPELHQQFRRVSGTKSFAELQAKAPQVRDIPSAIRLCVERISRCIPRADVCLYDFSRPEIPEVKVVRAFVSGVMNQIQSPPTCIPERVLDYRRVMGDPSGARFNVDELYLGPMLS
ncbi:MAG: YcaO-like family protein [Hyalangium sp.]|uniref:YcaO-like family protein n=1 Tax=Hyalangium sp. TaxID=2028555 RepID=UPI0038999E48